MRSNNIIVRRARAIWVRAARFMVKFPRFGHFGVFTVILIDTTVKFEPNLH